MPPYIVTANDIRQFCTNVYIALGVGDKNSQLLADTLCQADLWGHQSHGVMRTFWYAARMISGATTLDTPPELIVDAGAIAVLDGKNGIGQTVAARSMDEAISRSKQHGVGAVAVRNSGHFGTAMYFTRMAAVSGCVGFISTNASPAMAPWGGREKLIGNNPWSISAPAGKHPPMIMDIANTAVARGKLYLAKQHSQAIPDGWATDKHGNPTTDAIAGIAGNILPLAGHKGYAISTMMDMLSGVLTGSKFANDVNGPYAPEGDSGVGHMAIALNIEAFRPLIEFNADMEDLISRIKATPKAPGTDEIYYPGEIEVVTERQNLQSGITLPEKTVHELNTAARDLGVAELCS